MIEIVKEMKIEIMAIAYLILKTMTKEDMPVLEQLGALR